MSTVGKRLKAAREGVDREKAYPIAEAVKVVKSRAKAKFDETVEIAMNLGVDPKHADQMVRGVCNLPNGSGRTLRVAVFARGPKAEEAKAAGADVVGAEDLVEQVQGGNINFDRCIATPDMMGLVGRLGKVLGPRGLMPNPRVGTVTMDVTTAVKGAKGGAVEFRVEKAGIIQAGRRQGKLLRAAARRERQGVRRCGAEGEARRCQGQLSEQDLAELDAGRGRQGRRIEHKQRRAGVERRCSDTERISSGPQVRMIGWRMAAVRPSPNLSEIAGAGAIRLKPQPRACMRWETDGRRSNRSVRASWVCTFAQTREGRTGSWIAPPEPAARCNPRTECLTSGADRPQDGVSKRG